jgi:hypothetical protein
MQLLETISEACDLYSLSNVNRAHSHKHMHGSLPKSASRIPTPDHKCPIIHPLTLYILNMVLIKAQMAISLYKYSYGLQNSLHSILVHEITAT